MLRALHSSAGTGLIQGMLARPALQVSQDVVIDPFTARNCFGACRKPPQERNSIASTLYRLFSSAPKRGEVVGLVCLTSSHRYQVGPHAAQGVHACMRVYHALGCVEQMHGMLDASTRCFAWEVNREIRHSGSWGSAESTLADPRTGFEGFVPKGLGGGATTKAAPKAAGAKRVTEQSGGSSGGGGNKGE